MTNQSSKQMASSQKGKPSGEGKSKAATKTITDADNSDQQEEIREKYTEGPDEPAANVRVTNPNRNTDKPDIDKPAYS